MNDGDERNEETAAEEERALAERAADAALGFTRRTRIDEIARGLSGRTLARYAEAGALRDLMRKMDPLGTALANSGLDRIAKLTKPYDGFLHEPGVLADAIASARGALASSLTGIELPRWALIDDRPGAEHVLRAQRWAEQINSGSLAHLAERYAAHNRIGTEFESIARNASALRGLDELRGSITPNIDKLLARNAAFEQTLFKMSALAGAIDTVGPLSLATDATFEALLGGWRTRPDLPAEFWRRPSVRERYYREAEVDPGLIEADNAEVIEVLVESGVVEGEVRGTTVSAVVEAGPLSVRVSAARPRVGAYRVITAFEIAMRGLVAKTLAAAQVAEGADPAAWFRQRVPGDVLKRARERHAEALRAGEAGGELIAFVDLGDLIPIVTSRNNWSLFEPMLGSAEGFKVDMQRLNAWRRPTMHARPIDAVQLGEMAFTISRMARSIKQAGGWDPTWDEEG